ncbi:MAG: capsular biosynthesis protein, partial [Pseudobutyrivibrio sp.]|nr:capsular biosynthesis protein [Pseudobutyrivibrio sp.]
ADGNYCFVPVSDKVTLGEIVDLLDSFVAQSETFDMPSIPQGSFAKKLYSTYLSYLPEDKISYEFKTNSDDRGSFTELVHTLEGGQMSVNISKPGITKGQHWHHSKWELFIVVKGEALMQQRRIGVDRDGNPYPVVEKRVSGAKLEAVHMLPGYTHNIINLSETEELITLMWCNEKFEPERPDTYFEPV